MNNKKKSYIIEKDFIHSGLRCIVTFNNQGYRAGYVGVKNNNTFYGRYYDDDDVKSVLPCHGGLSYSSKNFKSNYPIESDLWWFGFDCMHFEDDPDYKLAAQIFPEMKEYLMFIHQELDDSNSNEEIRTVDYVMDECKKLAEILSNYNN